MNGACFSCGTELAETDRACPSCGQPRSKKCPFCVEEIPVLARLCPRCKSDLSTPTGEPVPGLGDAPPLEERGIAAIVALGLLTCGLYAFAVLHEQMKEVQAHAGKRGRGMDPTRDLILALATHFGTLGILPIWIYYVMFVYPRAFQETCVAEEIPCRDVLTPCALLAVMSTTLLCFSVAIPVWVFAVAVLQHELNQHARLHRRLAAVPA